VFAALPSVVENPFYLDILINIMLMGYLATAWGLVSQSGQLSFGHAAFIAVGAYTTAVLNQFVGIPPWAGMWIGALLATGIGAIIGYPTLRLRGVYFALATLAFVFILQTFVYGTRFIGDIDIGGAQGFHVLLVNGGDAPHLFQFDNKIPYYYIMLGMLGIVVFLSYFLNRKYIGYYWSAIRGDQDAAESIGVNASRYRFLAFLLSCFITGLGGAFYAQYYLTIDPRRILDLGFSLEIVLAGIVGGWQSVFGPMLGAAITTPIGRMMRASLGIQYPGLHLLIYGVILMLFIEFIPNGINEPLMKGIRWFENRRLAPARAENREVGR
jgi:branched-chain amino acid transport system permease protein